MYDSVSYCQGRVHCAEVKTRHNHFSFSHAQPIPELHQVRISWTNLRIDRFNRTRCTISTANTQLTDAMPPARPNLDRPIQPQSERHGCHRSHFCRHFAEDLLLKRVWASQTACLAVPCWERQRRMLLNYYSSHPTALSVRINVGTNQTRSLLLLSKTNKNSYPLRFPPKT